MNRRGFLTACIATLAAPAIVRAESLMPVRAQPQSGLSLLLDAQSRIEARLFAEIEAASIPTYPYFEYSPSGYANALWMMVRDIERRTWRQVGIQHQGDVLVFQRPQPYRGRA